MHQLNEVSDYAKVAKGKAAKTKDSKTNAAKAWPARWKACAGVILLLLALQQLGSGVWVMAKAVLAQYLIADAWQLTISEQQPQLPWPWADTWPVARLQWAEQNIDLYVLEGANGSSLAFGPGHLQQTSLPGDASGAGSIISGHRDTHFKFLSKIKTGHRVRLQGQDGRWHEYKITGNRVDNIKQQRLVADQDLQLLTCYPFNAIQAGGDLRYVVSAQKVDAGMEIVTFNAKGVQLTNL